MQEFVYCWNGWITKIVKPKSAIVVVDVQVGIRVYKCTHAKPVLSRMTLSRAASLSRTAPRARTGPTLCLP